MLDVYINMRREKKHYSLFVIRSVRHFNPIAKIAHISRSRILVGLGAS